MGSPVWALGGVGQDSAGKVARGSSRADWGRRCVPLTRGLRVPWGVIVLLTLVPNNPYP